MWRFVKLIIASTRFVAYFISSTPSYIARGVTHLKPLIEERYRKMAEFGDDWDEKPVSWQPRFPHTES